MCMCIEGTEFGLTSQSCSHRDIILANTSQRLHAKRPTLNLTNTHFPIPILTPHPLALPILTTSRHPRRILRHTVHRLHTRRNTAQHLGRWLITSQTRHSASISIGIGAVGIGQVRVERTVGLGRAMCVDVGVDAGVLRLRLVVGLVFVFGGEEGVARVEVSEGRWEGGRVKGSVEETWGKGG